MQLQHHIHAVPTALWPRCTKVELRNEMLYCKLALDNQYDLAEAYPKSPHIQFLNCRTTEDIQSFTRAWGPLHLVLTSGAEEIRFGTAIRRLDECEAHRRWLRAIKGMIEACRGRQDERRSLVEFLAAEVDIERTSNTFVSTQVPIFHAQLKGLFRYEGDSLAWAGSTDTGSIKRALAFSVQANVTAPEGRIEVKEKRKGFELKPGFSISTLWEALRWMIWMDEWRGWPPPVCLECHKFFPQLSAHERKYCSPKCAHRATNREWRRKDLRARKKR
jgi:hypothetical protein